MGGKILLRADALFLFVAGLGGFAADLRSYFWGQGPFGTLMQGDPLAIGSTEAHGLAVILAVTIFFAPALYQRMAHGVLAATHILLGGCNLLFWEIFLKADILAVGYIATGFHVFFALANLVVLLSGRRAAV